MQNSDARIRVVLTGSFAASACGLTVDLGTRRRGSPICKLARLLVDSGHDPDTLLHIYRDGESVRFERWRPMPSARRAVARLSGRVANSGAETPAGEKGALPGVHHD